ncbi:ATP-binding protein [Aliifodinibius sp. S!AR15-10]|uniref:ATP-binding protein n=1 Tax=Aliifodinibius sp. S!AR15-10 TaxID=2950437 RepID=UPI0028590474|nr:ATP-binding protein [Aliifodinibius sp. S!AR15-10]MDR8391409.1 ATP-binding protein [Aliifodinibius sp. S!AR15-10]
MPHFRTKARAVDLLGKGQIADLPTAITELWKNGYDAYGDNLEAHLYFSEYKNVKDPFFVISDDGKGMSEKDILEKWIVLGTDSKVRRQLPEKGPKTLWKKPRLPTGEKGIGRLSVAYLGSQMIMLTKKIGHPLQALFFDWRILDNYNLFVEDIDLPLKPINSTDNFDSIFSSLIADFKDNIPSENSDDFYKWEEHTEMIQELNDGIKAIDIPSFFENEIVSPLIDIENAHGTKFVILNPIDQLELLKNFDKSEDEEKDTVDFIFSCLSGLSNVFKTKREDTPFDTKFFIYDDEIPNEVISTRDFFDTEDFGNCDHVIQGKFNENGLFDGKVKIYNQSIEHQFRANRPPGGTPYGPFELKFGYVEGVKSKSSLNNEQYRSIRDKLDLYGGLYIYRDGFRVLPYGRSDYDFLKLEERRSKSAGYYYFSYRNMFGYIEISRETNSSLRDKAGREGFINNKAYQEFKSDLQAFFYDLARKYFGTDAEEDFRETQKEEIEQEKLEHEREKKERKEFAKKLTQLPKDLNTVENKLSDLNRQLQKKLEQATVVYDEIEQILRKIEECKIEAGNLAPPEPVRFEPTDHQRKKLYEYEKYYKEFNQSILNKTEDIVSLAQERLKERELIEEFERKVSQYEDSLKESIEQYKSKFSETFDKLKKEIDNQKREELKQFKEDYSSLTPVKPNSAIITKNLQLIENFFKERREEAKKKIEPLVDHIDKLTLGVNEDILVGYYKLQYQQLKERWEETQELAQLGIAVEIIDHQFNATYARLSNIISNLDGSLKEDEDSQRLYDNLRSLFSHLEDNYKLLTPLYRTTGRVRKDISGEEIKNYIKSFYRKELEEKNIQITSSKDFDKATYFTYESILKPVFINIVNNAIYWLRSSEERKIHFDYIDGKMLIMNSGEPIEDIYVRDGDIFKLFFTRKPKGRGIGLYLAKTTLNSVGFNIEASNDPKFNKLDGACFIIEKQEK